MSDDGTMETEQPQVTANTRFRRGGFKPAAEVIAEAEQASAAGQHPAEPAAEATDPDLNAIIAADPNFTFEMPEGVAPLTGAPAEEEAPAPEPRIRIGSREFATQEEAWAYAEELEQKKLVDDAFRHGVETAAQATQGNPQPVAPAPEVTQEIDPLYYTDPQAYFRKMRAEVTEQAKAAVKQDLQKQQSHDQTWNQFYSDYPDLTHARDLVDLTLQQNWNTLQHVETKQALKQLAEKTRAKLKPYVESQLPRVSLPKVATTASPGGAQQVTQPTQPAKPLNFTQQMNKLKKGRASFR